MSCIAFLRPDLTPEQQQHVMQTAHAQGVPDLHDHIGPLAETLFPLGTTVAFKSKHPYRTNWLSLSYPVDQFPNDLVAALAVAGWTATPAMRQAPPFGGRQELELGATGTSIFNSWTDDERKRYMAAARKVLRQHGYTRVPIFRLTLADML